MVFAATLSPVPQLNDSNRTFFTMDLIWIFQAILIFSFPYIIYIFGSLDIFYTIYYGFFIFDSLGKNSSLNIRNLL
ncbi:unnamed protein product [Paramecium sonneborni]|uniref:Uncharacterized protein n=1 Tax=Paramecium sonneborni TaxID=65129 RepID=A0A8S1QNL5_9CILI|nr:unnamed protein product [Paramecium sonneborni]